MLRFKLRFIKLYSLIQHNLSKTDYYQKFFCFKRFKNLVPKFKIRESKKYIDSLMERNHSKQLFADREKVKPESNINIFLRQRNLLNRCKLKKQKDKKNTIKNICMRMMNTYKDDLKISMNKLIMNKEDLCSVEQYGNSIGSDEDDGLFVSMKSCTESPCRPEKQFYNDITMQSENSENFGVYNEKLYMSEIQEIDGESMDDSYYDNFKYKSSNNISTSNLFFDNPISKAEITSVYTYSEKNHSITNQCDFYKEYKNLGKLLLILGFVLINGVF